MLGIQIVLLAALLFSLELAPGRVLVSSALLLFPLKTLAFNPQTKSSLANQHLRVIWTRRGGEYNSSYAGPKRGGLMLDYLAARFKFSYSFVDVKENYLYPTGKFKRGLVDYLIDGECDLLVHDVAMTSASLYKHIDLTLPWVVSVSDIMVPVPNGNNSANVYAVAKPFQWPVWIGIVISVVLVVFALKLIYRWSSSKIQTMKNEHDNPYLYTFGMLLSQGGHCKHKNLSARLMAGVWCLAAFVLVQAYSSTLFTYIVTPVPSPMLVNSVYDAFKKSEIRLVIEGGRSFESAIMSTTEKTGLFKQMRDKLNAFPKTRCYGMSDCVAMIKNGPNVVHANSYFYLLDFMIADYQATGKCDLQIINESFWSIPVAWGLQKGSSHMESLNKGILEMWEIGFMDLWELWFRPIPSQCQGNVNKQMKKPPRKKETKTARLTLQNLMGAFVVLLTGYVLSFVAYIGETVFYYGNRFCKKINVV